jgi:hypothetical protein
MHNILMAFPAHYNGYRVVSGNRSPTLGNSSTTWPPASPSAWTVLQNANADDASVAVPLPFTWTFNGTGYTTAYFGSNLYITFGTGSSNFSGLSTSNPPYNKIMFNAADRSFQRVAYLTSGTDYVRVRFEGGTGTSATLGASPVIFEVTFFNPSKTNNLPTLEFLIGNNGAIGGGTSGIYSSSALLTGGTWVPAATTSYVLQGTLPNANAWNIYTNYYISGLGY